MAKVKKRFYCSQEKKKYNVGDDYNGKRTDLGDYLEKDKKTLNPEVKKKPTSKKVVSVKKDK